MAFWMFAAPIPCSLGSFSIKLLALGETTRTVFSGKAPLFFMCRQLESTVRYSSSGTLVSSPGYNGANAPVSKCHDENQVCLLVHLANLKVVVKFGGEMGPNCNGEGLFGCCQSFLQFFEQDCQVGLCLVRVNLS